MTQSYLCSFSNPIKLALVFLNYMGAECQVTLQFYKSILKSVVGGLLVLGRWLLFGSI